MPDTEVKFPLTSRDKVAFEAASMVCRISSMWFYLKSWIQDFGDAIDDGDMQSASVLAKHIEYTASGIISAMDAGILSRIDIDDSAMIFGPKEYLFENAIHAETATGETATGAIDRFAGELSFRLFGDHCWMKTAIRKGHLKVLAEMAPELEIAKELGITDLLPRNWII